MIRAGKDLANLQFDPGLLPGEQMVSFKVDRAERRGAGQGRLRIADLVTHRPADRRACRAPLAACWIRADTPTPDTRSTCGNCRPCSGNLTGLEQVNARVAARAGEHAGHSPVRP